MKIGNPVYWEWLRESGLLASFLVIDYAWKRGSQETSRWASNMYWQWGGMYVCRMSELDWLMTIRKWMKTDERFSSIVMYRKMIPNQRMYRKGNRRKKTMKENGEREWWERENIIREKWAPKMMFEKDFTRKSWFHQEIVCMRGREKRKIVRISCKTLKSYIGICT